MNLKRKFPVCPFGYCVNKTYLQCNISRERAVGNEFIPLACSDGWRMYCYSGGLKKKDGDRRMSLLPGYQFQYQYSKVMWGV